MEELKRDSGTEERLLGFTPKVHKIERAEFAANQIEKGYVFLPHAAPWLEMFELELASFPHGTHDDLVDSLSQFFLRLVHGFPHNAGVRIMPHGRDQRLARSLPATRRSA